MRLRAYAAVALPQRELPVAVFDSGVGGLTVLHECLVSLPHEDFLYLGDTARFPYGDRSADELLGFARELAEILLERGAKLLVVACNSATAAALPALREELEGRVPVVGVVTPESRLAAAATKNGRVGLIATPATVASGAYARALAEAAPEAELHAVASAELAPLIQEGGEVDERVVTCVDGLCRPLREAGVDTVILGCTHYPLVRPVLQRALGRGVALVSSGEAIASEVDARLRDAGVAWDDERRGSYSFIATGDPEDFRRLGTRFLQLPIAGVEHVEVARPVRRAA
jgi:glutamate racemase